nr:MAG TPA: hypothetical protein [Caudoviricetes sp.]
MCLILRDPHKQRLSAVFGVLSASLFFYINPSKARALWYKLWYKRKRFVQTGIKKRPFSLYHRAKIFFCFNGLIGSERLG